MTQRPFKGLCFQRGRGVTLMELLVVIAIVAVLGAIAFPIVGHLQMQGRQTACLSNMRQIGTALMVYASDNDGGFPETTHTTGGRFHRAWIFQLKPYLADCDKVRICPADPKGKQRLEENGTSYILNSFVFVPSIGPFGERREAFNNIRRIPYPASTFLAFNISDEQGVTVMSDHTHSERWRGNWRRLCGEIEPDRHRTGKSNADHTNGTANYLFADGHVENIEAQRIRRWIDADVEFARVPLEPEDLQERAK